MIQSPPLWTSKDKINWLCLFMQEFLGSNSLEHAPLILSGYRSLQSSPLLIDYQQALRNIRLVAHRLASKTAIRKAVMLYNEHYQQQNNSILPAQQSKLFEIDEKKLTFKATVDILPPEYEQAKLFLQTKHQHMNHGQQIADVEKPLFLEARDFDTTRRYRIEGLPNIEENIGYIHPKKGDDEIVVPLKELFIEAQEMDEIDQLKSRREGNWVGRLKKLQLMSPGTFGEFEDLEVLTLAGLKHLIGLLGAGKTTLLMCVARWLYKQGYKVSMFFPSIEVCRQYLVTLRDYDVAAGLLMGRSINTRRGHARKLAETIATDDELLGFGRTLPGAEYYATQCVLPAYTTAAEDGVSPDGTFCHEILEKHEKDNGDCKWTHRLCPLWSKCGYHKAARSLQEASIWLGHIASTDALVPYQSTELKQRYFEQLATDFDVVIFDEADSVQNWLDLQGISQLTLTGDKDSFHADLQDRQNQMATEYNYALGDPRVFGFTMSAMDFSRHSHILVNAIQLLDEEQRGRYEGIFLTPHRLISSLVAGERAKSGLVPELEDKDLTLRKKEAVCQLWERAAVEAFYDRLNRKKTHFGKPISFKSIGENLVIEEAQAKDIYQKLCNAFRIWVTEEGSVAIDDSLIEVVDLFKPIFKKQELLAIMQKTRLLMAVTFTVLGYRKLAPHSDALVEQGFLAPSHVESRCSDDLLKATTANILGNLSGVRFFLDTHNTNHPRLANVKLQYVVFSGSPRAYMYHLHRNHGENHRAPAVLLASATSFLEQSPAYHVNVTPDYVVKAQGAERRFEKSKFVFEPIENMLKPGQKLRYSGEESSRVRNSNLEKMVRHLLQGGVTESVIGQAISEFDAEPIKRKAALVVNSYAQCKLLKSYINNHFKEWAHHTVAVVDTIEHNQNQHEYVTAAQAEQLGDREEVKIIIFAIGAIGRGTNIVFTKGDRRLDAAIGTMYFLTRPHPSTDDLSLLVSMAARSTEDFNDRDLSMLRSLDELAKTHYAARRKTFGHVARLLTNPLMASRLGPLLEPFTANMAVNLLQTIGRGMRNGCPVQCIFVDAAWARMSAKNDENSRDTAQTSMLVQLIEILRACVNNKEPEAASVYKELYEAFLHPLELIDGLRIAKESEELQDSDIDFGHGSLYDDDPEYK